MASIKEPNVFDARRADKGYLSHIQRLATATSVVDHHPPSLQTSFYLKVTGLSEGTQRLRSIVKDNKVLVQAINITNRTKGKTDTRLRPYVRHPQFDSATLPLMLQVEKDNKAVHERIQKTPAVYGFWELHREWLRNKCLLRTQRRYPRAEPSRTERLRMGELWSIERMPSAPEDRERVRQMRPRVLLELATSEHSLGRLEVELYRDAVPLTVDNFLSLCRGDGPRGLCYRGTPLFRVNPGLYAQGGDVVGRTGARNSSAHGDTFPPENFQLQHSGPGVLSMCATPWCSHEAQLDVGSQFVVTFRALHALDGKNVVFGKMVRGEQTLFNIESLGTRSGKPSKEVVIKSCCEVDRDATNSKH